MIYRLIVFSKTFAVFTGLLVVVCIVLNNSTVNFNQSVTAGKVNSSLIVNLGYLNENLIANGNHIFNLFNTLNIKF